MLWPQLFNIFRCAFGFLQAQHVRFVLVKKFQKVFAQHGTQAIDIPRDQFHGNENTKSAAESEWRCVWGGDLV